MLAGRLRSLLLVGVLIAGACGDDSGGITTTSTVPTTTSAAVTTTTALAIGPLDRLEGIAVEDPCYDSGFQMFELLEDGALRVVVDGGTVVLRKLEGVDASGLGAERILVTTECGDPDDGIALGFAMYTLAGSAWEATITVAEPDLRTVLEGTTDYAAAGLSGPVKVVPTLVSFAWSGAAEFVVDVEAIGGADTYVGQLGCTHDGTTLECTTLSDDRVLRPGDEGEEVEALQQALEELGYLDGPIDGKYGPGTEAAVRAFQRDFWLTRDGKAGPETRALIDDLLSGDSDLILIDRDQIGPIDFTTPQNDVIRPTANPSIYQGALVNLFGQPDDYETYVSGCDAASWIEASWGAFTAILTTRDGPMQLDGWKITELGALDSRFRIGGGIRPTWRWSDFEAAGAGYDPTYGEFFYMLDLEYNNGRFVSGQGATPSANAVIRGFGTGTGAFVSC